MANYYVKQASGTPGTGTNRNYFATSTAYSLGDRVFATQAYGTATGRRYCFECTTAGTSGGTQPTWSTTVGGTTTSNTAVFTTRACTTWTNSHISLACLLSSNILTGGDTAYVSSGLNESNTSNMVSQVATNGNFDKTRIVSVDDTSGEPPTTMLAGATVSHGSQAASMATFYNGHLHVWGLNITASTSASSSGMQFTGSNKSLFENCNFVLPTGAASSAVFSFSPQDQVTFRNCTFKFSNTNHSMYGGGRFEGCSIASGSTALLYLWAYGLGIVSMHGCDLSNMGSAANIVGGPGAWQHIELVNCKLPSSWTGAACQAVTHAFTTKVRMVNCDSGDTNYKYQLGSPFGYQTVETTLVRTGGASDGTTPMSWKFVTNSNTPNYHCTFEAEPIAVYNTSVGSAKTVTVEFLHDSLTSLTNAEVWLDVFACTTSGVPLYSLTTTRPDILVTSFSNLSTSSETWTTTGMTYPLKQKVSATFTPQEAGFILVKVRIAKASKTLYICPKVSVA